MLFVTVVGMVVFGVTLIKGDNISGASSEGTPEDVTDHPNLSLINHNICGLSSNSSSGTLFQVPWIALLVYQTSRGVRYLCVGTLISERYVLTAAYCVKNLPSSTKLVGVRLGEYDYNKAVDCEELASGNTVCADSPVDIGIEQVIPHTGYSKEMNHHDTALLRLNSSASFTSDSVKPICLPVKLEERTRLFHEGEVLTVVGWGRLSTGVQSSVVRSVHVEYVPTEDCAAAYKNFTTRVEIFDDQLCLRGTTAGDATRGDGGGPLVTGGFETQDKVIQYGIVSFGPSSGLNPPGLYVRVPSYMKWILDNMRGSSEGTPPQA